MTAETVDQAAVEAPVEETASAPAEAEAKPRYKLAMYWASACGGCDVAVLNLGM